MGEAKRRAHTGLLVRPQTIRVEALNGPLQVRWDSESAATPFGQMAFFLEFIHLTGLYARLGLPHRRYASLRLIGAVRRATMANRARWASSRSTNAWS